MGPAPAVLGDRLGGPIDQGHGQLAVADLDRFAGGAGVGQGGPGSGDAGSTDLDGVSIKLPGIIAVNELELCACHGYHFDEGV